MPAYNPSDYVWQEIYLMFDQIEQVIQAAMLYVQGISTTLAIAGLGGLAILLLIWAWQYRPVGFNRPVLQMAPRALLIVLAAAALLLTGCTSSSGEPEQEQAPQAEVVLTDGWNRILPGGDTMCSDGSEYAFYARPGDPDKLMIYFQGGGACWNGENCHLERRPTYDPVVNERDDPTRANGIFALDHPENPLADYSMVHVTYCTADTHIGDTDRIYDVPATDSIEATQVTIHHRGYANATAVLDWAAQVFDSPETVFVAGVSAGAVAAPFYAERIARMYPGVRLEVLADGGGGYRLEASERSRGNFFNRIWGVDRILPDFPEYTDVPADSLTPETFFAVFGKRHPEATLAQYNAAEDHAQRFFQKLRVHAEYDTVLADTKLQPLLDANHADIRASIDNFRAFTAGGGLHMILHRPEFYTYAAEGVRVRDWVAALVNGEDVPDVRCTECAVADSIVVGI